MRIVASARAVSFRMLLPVIIFAGSIGLAAADPTLDPLNGHYYQIISPAGGIDWADARASAASMTFMGVSGHLATITSAAEDEFVLSLFDPNSPAGQAWIRGIQPAGSPEPGGGWQWITGETWSFTNWYVAANGSTEPNNDGVMKTCLAFITAAPIL